MHDSLAALFSESAARHASRVAIRHPDGDTTYADLDVGVERVAGVLREMGLAGTRVGILLPNLPAFPLIFHAAQRAGCGTLLLNPLNSTRETAEYLSAASVSTIFTTSALLPLIPHGTTALLVDPLPRALGIADGADPREVELTDPPAAPPPATRPDDEAVVLFTAANTGWARGAVLTHRNLIANLTSTREAMRITPEDCLLGALPYIHGFGLTVTLNAALAAGASILPVDRFRPAGLLEVLEESPATLFAGVPAMFGALLHAAGRRSAPRHRLRLAVSGGAPLPRETAYRWEEVFGIPLRQGYGLTEAGPVCLFNDVDRPNRPGTLGSAFPGVEVSIRDEAGHELAPDEVGELCVRGENVFPGYLGEGGRQPGDFHGDWLRTGDLASRDGDGIVRFRGMLKPMFTRNGFNVYPHEIERVLEAEPGVERARVLALPDAHRENEVVLVLKLAPSALLDEAAIRTLCRARLAAYKQPARIEIEP